MSGSNTASAPATKPPRIDLLDIARGVALIAMAIFHFNFDLELLGLKPSGYIDQTHWVYFARSIAGSFLFLVGFSLYLGHSGGFIWRPYGFRLAKIIASAALITVATWFATPDIFIFFGILHAIALASVLGLVFLQFPWFITLIAAIFVVLSRPFLRTEMLDSAVWWWSGLSQITPRASDYVPMFPWFGWVLAGIAAAKFAESKGWFTSLASLRPKGKFIRGLKFLGRHSLIFYLVHQPVLIAVLWLGLKVSGSR